MAKVLIILNEQPYGTERSYNGLRIVRRGGKIGVCGTCMDARGISDAELVEGTHRSTMAELTEWVRWADKTVTF